MPATYGKGPTPPRSTQRSPCAAPTADELQQEARALRAAAIDCAAHASDARAREADFVAKIKAAPPHRLDGHVADAKAWRAEADAAEARQQADEVASQAAAVESRASDAQQEREVAEAARTKAEADASAAEQRYIADRDAAILAAGLPVEQGAADGALCQGGDAAAGDLALDHRRAVRAAWLGPLDHRLGDAAQGW